MLMNRQVKGRHGDVEMSQVYDSSHGECQQGMVFGLAVFVSGVHNRMETCIVVGAEYGTEATADLLLDLDDSDGPFRGVIQMLG
jgi:hypothetical protein